MTETEYNEWYIDDHKPSHIINKEHTQLLMEMEADIVRILYDGDWSSMELTEYITDVYEDMVPHEIRRMMFGSAMAVYHAAEWDTR